MRKSVGLGIGLASVAILAVAGIASANAATGSGVAPASRQTTMASTVVSQADAERIAQAAVPNSTVTESRLDTDNGRTVWNVHLSTPTGEVDVKVDAQTGAVRIDDDQPNAGATATSDDNDGDNDGGTDGSNHDGTDGHGNDDHGSGGSDQDGSGHN
jgi:hypothetical protein